MGADVRRQINKEVKPGSGDPITRDFLGGCFGIESKELDLDLHVPPGCEKRLDLQSGKVYIQRRISPDHQTAPSSVNFQPNLELNLLSNWPSNSLNIYKNATYQSVCTLDKVKSALERVSSSKKRPSSSNSDSSMISNSSPRDRYEKGEKDESGMLVAGACPSCLMYVLMCKINPRCPKCNSVISLPSPSPSKKPKIDLNM